MPKFFIKNNQINEYKITIKGEDVNHIKNVFRKNVGDTLKVCNEETGKNYIVEILNLNNESIETAIKQEVVAKIDSSPIIHIYQGLPKADKMELIIQKSVELGASKIVPVAMKRCIVKIAPKDEPKKIQRWQKISESASKQCGRNSIPKIENITIIKNICDKIDEYDAVLVAYENEENNKLKYELQKLKQQNKNNLKIAIIIGPEGGLEPEDVEMLKQKGAKIVTLGDRILRTETVALNMLSVINYEFED